MELPKEPLDDPFRGPHGTLLTIRVPDTLYAALERTAKKESITLSLLVRSALFFQFFPSVMEHQLNSIGEQSEAEEALITAKSFRRWLDNNRERLDKLLASYQTLRRGEAFALELEEKLQQLEKGFAKAWKQFAKQVKEEDELSEMEAAFTELMQPKGKTKRKEKTA